MPAAESIKEYLIGLGFDLDLQGFKRFNHILAETEKGFLEVGGAAVATASAVGLAVERVASNYADLFYLSQRTGSSVQSLQSAAFGFSQIGLSAEAAKAAINSLAMATYSNPGNLAYLRMLGVTANDAKTQFEQLIDHLPDNFIGATIASRFGIPAQEFHQLKQNRTTDKEAEKDLVRRQNAAGVNAKTLTEHSVNFMRDLHQLESEFGVLGDKIGQDFIDPADRMIKTIEGLVENLLKADKATDGWITTIGALAASFGALKLATKSLGWLAALFGGGAAAEAGAAAKTGLMGRLGPSALAGYALLKTIEPTAAGGGEDEAKRQRDMAARGLDPNGHPLHGGHWWTGARYAHAVERLEKEAGLSPLGAKALVARWAFVESPNGPGSVNPSSGAFGIAQWLGNRKTGIAGDTNFDDQLTHAIHELNTSERRSAFALRHAKTASDAARGASMYERAEGYNPATGFDNYTNAIASRLNNITPLGADSASAKGDVNLNQNTTITVHGGEDPKTTAGHVLKGQQNVNADLVRNAGNTVR